MGHAARLLALLLAVLVAAPVALAQNRLPPARQAMTELACCG